ncbi:ArsC/Spx/MgsR family protein [Magnetococcus sp. PR-3]|uniref:ArsC/Spx/MgsR family protein n=1 Tax=Magnetococcus sp. PR-3 TaxID=3120355 RepID=UPI002FCE3F90
MAHIIFYEKPGCLNNRLQKVMLTNAGHTLEVRNLLEAAWSPMTLRPFFGSSPVTDWFNRSAPQIKSGKLDPATFDELSALQMMVENPLLIRRPLMQSGSVRKAGFEPEEVDSWVGLQKGPLSAEEQGAVLELCPAEHRAQKCTVRAV